LNNTATEKVGRFLLGIPNARERGDVSEISALDDQFSEWLYDKIVSTRAIGAYDADRSEPASG
jgi:hypothetical protein